jgi:hypothetical protein
MHADLDCEGLVLLRCRESSVERPTMATISHEARSWTGRVRIGDAASSSPILREAGKRRF